MSLSLQDRVKSYHKITKYPESLWMGGDNRISGTWIMGQNYRVKGGYYGGYPAGYLRRVKALFPDKEKTLHLFSGKVDTNLFPGDTVDMNEALNPTYIDDAQTLEGVPLEDYDLILADPPYSVEDADHYQTPMVKRNKVMRALSKTKPGTHIVWLDQVFPMFRKDTYKLEGCIGMLKSTNHRIRMVLIFERL